MNIKIKKIKDTKAGIPEYSKLEMKLFNSEKTWEAAWISYLEKWDKLTLAYLENDNNKIGLLGWAINPVSKNKSLLEDGGFDPKYNFSFLMAIAIEKDYRGKSLGNKLMEYYIEESTKQGVDILALRVDPANTVSIKLYEKYGFKEYDRHGNNLMMARKV